VETLVVDEIAEVSEAEVVEEAASVENAEDEEAISVKRRNSKKSSYKSTVLHVW
jgi:hypothetical protein